MLELQTAPREMQRKKAEKEPSIPFNFSPRTQYQLPLCDYMDSHGPGRRAVCVWHRRAGKDKTFVNICAKEMLKRVGTYYYLFPTYQQGKKILWEGMDRDGFKFTDHIPHALRKRTDNSNMLIELTNGSIFQVIGTDKIDSIVGTNPIGCIFSEYALQNPAAWNFIRPILRENDGFAIFNFTPRGKNHGYRLFEMAKKNPRWFCDLRTVGDTKKDDGSPVLTEADIEEERREGMDEELIQQEYYCSFNASVVGSYYGKLIVQAENENRIRQGILYDPSLAVHTAWDIGTSDYTSIILFQYQGDAIRIFDYIEYHGQGVEYYINTLIDKGYNYASHIVPHDFNRTDFSSGKSSFEVAVKTARLRGEEFRFVQAPKIKNAKRGQVLDGIDQVRRIFPRLYINQDGDDGPCQSFIDAISSYHKEWDEDRKHFKDLPEHDWSSHAADALRYLAVSLMDNDADEARKKQQVRMKQKQKSRFRGHVS